jgi:hypothetical protein
LYIVKRLALPIVAAALVLGLGGCALFNMAPVVVVTVSTDQLQPYDPVFLDASQTSDPESDDLEFHWSIIASEPGSSVSLDTPDSAGTWFDQDMEGTYVIKLLVSDGTNAVEAEIEITVSIPEA